MAGRGLVVVDAGPLILLAAGMAFADRLKVTARYGRPGYRALAALLVRYDGIVVTPHALAEAWNMSGSDDERNRVARAVKLNLLRYIETAIEAYDPARSLMADNHVLDLGLADVAQLAAATARRAPLLTTDRKLTQIARSRGLDAVHIDELVAASPG